MTAAAIQSNNHSPQAASLEERLAAIYSTEIDFIPNSTFRVEDSEPSVLVDELLSDRTESKKTPADLPPHLKRMCETELLTHAEEAALFRAMNLAKYRASAIREGIDPHRPDEGEVSEVETLLRRAEAVRDHLIQANMRLVMSVVKKFVTPQQSFDEMLSDGIFTLMQAVEKFDFDRGFRFSTYAYRSIARNAYRAVTTARKEEARVTRDAEDWAFEQEYDYSSSSMSDQMWGHLRELTASMINRLDRRERFIIRSRYALGAHRRVRTFQFLADKLGVSKERVRQLEQRAVNKLQAMAAEQDIDEMLGAAVV